MQLVSAGNHHISNFPVLGFPRVLRAILLDYLLPLVHNRSLSCEVPFPRYLGPAENHGTGYKHHKGHFWQDSLLGTSHYFRNAGNRVKYMKALQRVRYSMRTSAAAAPAPIPVVGEEMKPTQSNNASPDNMLPFALPVDRVLFALTNSGYDWRSAEQISQETHIPESHVLTILEDELSHVVVRSFDRDYPDRYFYTTRDHYEEIRGGWHNFLSIVCDQIR
jgi:hypothetical protein